MKVPLRWLMEFIDLPTTDIDELSYSLDMLGLSVEGVEEYSVEWTNVLVGKVVEIAPHPDADRVRVCQVDTGQGPEQIICGAWNFEEGAYVAVAKPGAVLPGDFKIGQRTIRGVESNGMICSEKELGLGEVHEGILVLDGEPPLGVPFEDLLELPDVVFELEVTPNRPDALSLYGIARELAAWYDVEARVPPLEMSTSTGETSISVSIEDPSGCRRFTAREIRGVEIGESPLSVRLRLHKVGVRSISNVVDVTNYVMFELGHPLHAFDAEKIEGDRLVVKRATDGEALTTLDGQVRHLMSDDLIIYDDAGPTSMSGTMGGERSEVSDSTTRVLMEAASWDPPTIMHMWRRYDLRSEAATRFERGVDPNLADTANQRASAMVQQLAGGQVLEGAVDEVAVAIEPWTIELELSDVLRILGPGFTSDHVRGILGRLGMDVEGDSSMRVTVPTFRPDITRSADLIEEVARVHGFDKFESTLPTGPTGGLTASQVRTRLLTRTLTGVGLHQAINLPFVGMADLEAIGLDITESDLLTVKNPLREEESKLRPSLMPGLLDALRYNLSHGAETVALFELGNVFSTSPSDLDPRLPHQTERVAWAAVGQTGLRVLGGEKTSFDGPVSLGIWRRVSEALGLGAVELSRATPPGYHPGRTAELKLEGRTIGIVGELTPSTAKSFGIEGRVAAAEIDLMALVEPVDLVQAKAPSVFPPVDFDLSFVMTSEKPSGELMSVTSEAAGDLLESAVVFDEFLGLGDDKKALAISYRLRAPDRTLSNEEMAPIRQAMIDAAASIGATLRGA